MLFNNTFQLWNYKQYLIENKTLAEMSLYNYCSAVEKFLVTNPDISDIEYYNRFIIKHSIKKRSNYYYSALKSFIEYTIDDKGLRASMVSNLIKPEIKTTLKQERKYLSEKEILGIINHMRIQKHKIIALIQDLTGVRAGDVLRIRKGNIIPEIYDEKAVVKIIIDGKGDKRNVVYIHDEIAQKIIMGFVVKNFISSEYHFLENIQRVKTKSFEFRRKYKANYIRYYRDLKQAMYQVGVNNKDFATHDYRRCYARRVWNKYKDITVLQNLLNHVNPATSIRYLKQSGMQNVDYHKEMQS